MTASVIETTVEDHRIARLAALAISLMWVDAALPSPVPGVKPGLANIVTLVVLRRHGLSAAIWVTALRVVGGSMLLGRFLTPGFALSASGAVASLLVLSLLTWLPRGWLTSVGLSIPAAFAHIAAQLLLVEVWLMPGLNLWPLVPGFALFAWLGGLVNGLVAERLLRETTNE